MPGKHKRKKKRPSGNSYHAPARKRASPIKDDNDAFTATDDGEVTDSSVEIVDHPRLRVMKETTDHDANGNNVSGDGASGSSSDFVMVEAPEDEKAAKETQQTGYEPDKYQDKVRNKHL